MLKFSNSMPESLRIIIVAIHVGAMKIYVTLEAPRRKERGVKRRCTQITTKIDGFLSFGNVLFLQLAF